MVAALVITGWYLGWFSGLGPLLSFAIYWTLITLIQVLSLLYVWLRSRHPDAKAALWIPMFNLFLGVVSYMGSLGPLSTPMIPYPWDYITFAVLSLAVYFIAVELGYETKDLKEIKQKGLPIE